MAADDSFAPAMPGKISRWRRSEGGLYTPRATGRGGYGNLRWIRSVRRARSGDSSILTLSAFTSATMICAHLVVHVAEQAVGLHLLGLVAVVVGGADVVDRRGPVAMDQEQVDERHQALLAQGHVEGVLVADRSGCCGRDGRRWMAKITLATFSPAPVVRLSSSSSEPAVCGPQRHPQRGGQLMVLGPGRQPLLEQLGRHLGLHQVLVLGRALAHRLGRGGAARRGHQRRVAARSAHQRLRRPVGRVDQAELPLQPRQRTASRPGAARWRTPRRPGRRSGGRRR